MAYQEYSTFQKVEQLIRMVQRDDVLKRKLQEGDVEAKLQVLNLVGLRPEEMVVIKEDLENIFGMKAVSVWVPT